MSENFINRALAAFEARDFWESLEIVLLGIRENPPKEVAAELKRLRAKLWRKRGCPTCSGLDPKSCMRCQGRTKLSEWCDGEVQ
jgi:hypothetical protein